MNAVSEIPPILRALGRNRIGALLIGLQIALTLGIVCNALAIIVGHLQHMRRPSGIDEANIFTLRNEWVGHPVDLKARTEADLAALRSTPGVIDAIATNSFPLHSGGWSTGLSLAPEQRDPTARAAQYMVDEHALAAYGIAVEAGRWFTPQENRGLRAARESGS